jgi:hypothetical protein
VDKGSDMLMNDSDCIRLLPQSWQTKTDRKVPSKRFLISSAFQKQVHELKTKESAAMSNEK